MITGPDNSKRRLIMTVASCETKIEFGDMDCMIDMFAEQVPIRKEHGDKSTGIGFGEFLLYEGKIDAYELEGALHYQSVEHVALGIFAVREKYLDNKQLCDVLDCQRERGGLFGEIAIELGFINKDGVDDLLEMQSEEHIKIGDVLVLFGAISREDMESRLQHFHASV
jgi:hypothetical protein